MKNFFASKLNWTGIALVIVAVQSVIANQDFSGMGVKDWVTFTLGILIVVFRTFATSTKIGKAPANTPAK